MELRDKVKLALIDADCGEGWYLTDHAGKLADAILAIPEIAEALEFLAMSEAEIGAAKAELTRAAFQHAKQAATVSTKPDR